MAKGYLIVREKIEPGAVFLNRDLSGLSGDFDLGGKCVSSHCLSPLGLRPCFSLLLYITQSSQVCIVILEKNWPNELAQGTPLGLTRGVPCQKQG